jgi:L-alanine-DL-glutamate epimerase-like enolase superfamily enzyme
MNAQFRPYPLKMNHPWAISSSTKSGGGWETIPMVLLRLSDKGVTGLGEAPSSSRYGESPETVQAFFRKVDWSRISFEDVPASMDYLEKLAPSNYSPKCAINVALVDGAARIGGLAVCDFLGLGFAELKHVTSFSIGIDTPAMIGQKVEEAAAFPILKLKIGAPGERENLAALRQAAPKRTVRVDANEGWKTKEEALRNLEWLAKDPHIEFVEQPMPASTPIADLAWLKERSPLPLFGDESYHHAKDIGACAECYHGVNVKLMKAGGISGAHEALNAARKAGLKTMIGCMIETSVLITAAAHLAELTDHLDIDGALLISNDPFSGATAHNGVISFASAAEKTGLRVKTKDRDPFSEPA